MTGFATWKPFKHVCAHVFPSAPTFSSPSFLPILFSFLPVLIIVKALTLPWLGGSCNIMIVSGLPWWNQIFLPLLEIQPTVDVSLILNVDSIETSGGKTSSGVVTFVPPRSFAVAGGQDGVIPPREGPPSHHVLGVWNGRHLCKAPERYQKNTFLARKKILEWRFLFGSRFLEISEILRKFGM